MHESEKAEGTIRLKSELITELKSGMPLFLYQNGGFCKRQTFAVSWAAMHGQLSGKGVRNAISEQNNAPSTMNTKGPQLSQRAAVFG